MIDVFTDLHLSPSIELLELLLSYGHMPSSIVMCSLSPHPWMLQRLSGCKSCLRVHHQHIGYQMLQNIPFLS